ncbi:hypothetical protein pipiens_006465 [Culex pipiens pipiens]|uniref:C2H2-type domain-containing protein n=1 Tax=Culex pipiens pipiens TaxID=38569 RepID=A0ABD1DPE2_CULPP
MPTSVIATDTDDESFIHLESLYDVGAKVEPTPSDFMDGGGSSLLTGGDPPLVTADLRRTTVHESQSQVKEIISYQRYGKIDKTVFSTQKFKCHLWFAQGKIEYLEEIVEPGSGTVLESNTVVFEIKSQPIDMAETIEYLVSAEEEDPEPSKTQQQQLLPVDIATENIPMYDNPQLAIVLKKERRIPSHMRPRTNTEPRFECPKCGKAYSLAKNMRRHARLECGQEPKYACPYCPLRYARPARPQAATSTAAAAAKKLKTITVTTPQLTTTSATVLESASQVAQITANTPVILNDLNDCLLESKNIVVSKKDNKYILFTTAAPEPISLQPATTSQIQSITLQPLQVSAATVTAPAAATLHTATVIDTGRIEELLKRDKIIKKTELQSDGTTTTTYIFDECDILPLKTTSKNVINTAPTVQQATSVKPTTLSIVKVAPDNVITTGGGATATVVPAVPQPALPATLISASPNPSQIISTKKLLKPTHPRIKYSKHKNPSVQSVAALPILTIPTVPSSNIGQSLSLSVPEAPVGTTTTKIELLNFSLSRKFPGQNTKTIDVSNIQQIPITAVSKPVPTTRYTVSDYETITSNTSQSNDFTSGMIDDLDYSVIDDIELPDDVQVNFAESYSSSKGAHGATTEDDEDDGDDSQDAPKPLPGKKSTGKTEAKILNASMDDKYALLANTSIMKNFEYTVNESVVSDGDDGEMRQYICRHCGKRYRWKSTLRRHENVECGGKEAMHQCPYCTYKAKQRGNLGVHIRKHHSEMPQLESRRKSKTRDSLNLIESIKAEAEGQL